MVDIMTPDARRRLMSSIGSRNTGPESLVRHGLHALGFRYRLNDRRLPGKPDIVFPKWGAVIFVHGCFWHGHDCHLFTLPKTRTDFWLKKIEGNRRGDGLTGSTLGDQGWRVGVVWECSLKGRGRLDLEDAMHSLASWLRSDVRTYEMRGTA